MYPSSTSDLPGKSFDPRRLKRISELEQWHFWFAGRQALVTDFLRQCLRPDSDWLLDLGCGTGFLLQKYDSNHRVIGLDLLRDGLMAMRQTNPTALLLQGEAVHIPLKNEVLNGIVMLDVLEHVDDFAVLKEASRVLARNGWLILSVPAMRWLWSYRDRAAGHLRRYNRQNLKEILGSSEFQVEKIRYYQFFLFPLVALSRFIGRNSSMTRDLEEKRISFLNRILTWINKFEAKMSRWISWPWGSSMIVICRKIN